MSIEGGCVDKAFDRSVVVLRTRFGEEVSKVVATCCKSSKDKIDRLARLTVGDLSGADMIWGGARLHVLSLRYGDVIGYDLSLEDGAIKVTCLDCSTITEFSTIEWDGPSFDEPGSESALNLVALEVREYMDRRAGHQGACNKRLFAVVEDAR